MQSKSPHTLIIAEAGVNHNGHLHLAKKLVDVAAAAGADYVKFQTFKAEMLASEKAGKAGYQKKNMPGGEKESQIEMLKKLELNENSFRELFGYCKGKKIGFMSSPFDLDSIDFLKKLGLKIFKIPSGEITNLPLLEKIGRMRKKVILSTGMSTMKEIGAALHILVKSGTSKKNIIVLHCNSGYPTPMDDVNLRAMLAIRDKFKVKTGYSDHTMGIEVPVAAVALGATVIEKHFTLDRNMKGPDHKISLEPDELAAMVKAVRNIEVALGTGKKKPTRSELKNRNIARKSIHLAHDLKTGQRITAGDLIMKRPGDGISPMAMKSLIGKKTWNDLKKNHKLSKRDFY